MRFLVAFLAACAFAGAAHGADLTVSVTANGAPVADAVVTFHPAQPVRGPIRFDWPYRIAQHNIAFEPNVLIVPVGATVAFPNLDRVRHHVFSFSPGNRFELQLYGRDETRTFTFSAAGVAAIGCNIHDQMAAYVVVVDTPFAAKTDAAGRAVLNGASGAGELRVWHANSRARDGIDRRPLALAASGAVAQSIALTLRPAGRAHH